MCPPFDGCPVLNQTLDASERLGEGEDLGGHGERVAGGDAALELEGGNDKRLFRPEAPHVAHKARVESRGRAEVHVQ